MKILCPNCSQKIEVDESFGGQSATCPTCSREFEIPELNSTGNDDDSSPEDNKLGVVLLVIIVVGVIYMISSFCSSTSTSNSVIIGDASGEYVSLTHKKLASRAIDYLNKSVEIEMEMSDLDISINYQRLEFHPIGSTNVDVLVKTSSPLYDKIIEIDPKFGDLVIVRGTVKMYSNTYDSIFIIPDQLEFKTK